MIGCEEVVSMRSATSLCKTRTAQIEWRVGILIPINCSLTGLDFSVFGMWRIWRKLPHNQDVWVRVWPDAAVILKIIHECVILLDRARLSHNHTMLWEIFSENFLGQMLASVVIIDGFGLKRWNIVINFIFYILKWYQKWSTDSEALFLGLNFSFIFQKLFGDYFLTTYCA